MWSLRTFNRGRGETWRESFYTSVPITVQREIRRSIETSLSLDLTQLQRWVTICKDVLSNLEVIYSRLRVNYSTTYFSGNSWKGWNFKVRNLWLLVVIIGHGIGWGFYGLKCKFLVIFLSFQILISNLCLEHIPFFFLRLIFHFSLLWETHHQERGTQ